MVDMGEKIRQMRKVKGFTQQQLADQVGVSRRLIGDVEAGKGTSLLVFVKILKVFNRAERVLDALKSNDISAKAMYLKEHK